MQLKLRQLSTKTKWLLFVSAAVLIWVGAALRPRALSPEAVWNDDDIVGRSMMSLRFRYGWESSTELSGLSSRPQAFYKTWTLRGGGRLTVFCGKEHLAFASWFCDPIEDYSVSLISPLSGEKGEPSVRTRVRPMGEYARVPTSGSFPPPRFLRRGQLAHEYFLDGELWSFASDQGKIAVGVMPSRLGGSSGVRLAVHLAPPSRPDLWETVSVQWFRPQDIEPTVEHTNEGSFLIIRALSDHRELMCWNTNSFYHLPTPEEVSAAR